MHFGDAKLLVDEGEFGPAAQAMVDNQLVRRGIRNPQVLRAMRSVPRHTFLGVQWMGRAYDDCALPTRDGQTISQPYMVAAMTELLDLQPHHKVLEIGTGSGYQTMILAMLAQRVVSLELVEPLAEQARETLEGFEVTNVTVHVADGTRGWPADAPYDRILVTAAADKTPPALLDQLAEGGRLVIPLGPGEVQTLTWYDKEQGRLTQRQSFDCRFVPFVGARATANPAASR